MLTFTGKNGLDHEILMRHGLEPCSDGRLVVRRIVRATGANQAWINERPVSVQVLQEIGERLVDMHGPHDHQSLLSEAFQIDLLDAFGHLRQAQSAYEQVYEQRARLEARRAELEALGGGDIDAQLDLLRHRVREIESAALVEGEEEQVAQEQRLVGGAQRVVELGGAALDALTEGEVAAFGLLAAAQRPLEELGRLAPEAEEWKTELRDLAARVQDISESIHHLLDRTNLDPARLQWLDERLALYRKLKQKYGPGVPEILATLDKARQRLRDLETRGEQLEALEAEIKVVQRDLQAAGEALRAGRQAAARKLSAAITRELRALGFAHGAFVVDVQDAESPRPTGLDSVEFGFAPNPGEPLRSLRAIASSGEISRVMLASKVVLARHDRIPVLVFDEIDANVGGEMGASVGRKLAEAARNRQVICITHLPQVAACGSAHYAVQKRISDGRTSTSVERLEGEERVEEVARMLGGRDLTSVTLRHARELLAGHVA